MASSPANCKASVSSSSSPSVPCRPNPKPRSSETGDLMRQSFRANPFPADLSRRNSARREISRVDFGDKENQNDKDQISNVVKAPKGVKNFMSPTISAVSKINASPRKKILSDKNEVPRSLDKTHHHQICVDKKKQFHEEESHDITVTDLDESHGNKSNGDFDDSSFKISPLPPSVPYAFAVFESHQVDPSLAPYDPKKNYLSPRPQFLHYRPNPRVEHHFDECKQLEELFSSESSSSDTGLSAEESQLEEEVTSKEGVVAVEEETEVIKDESVEERLEAAEVDEEVVVGESTEEEETHQFSKQSRFNTSKLLGWILVLGVAYLLLASSVTFTQPSIIQDSQFYKFHIPPEITKTATESFEQFSVKLRMWAESSLVYMDKLISSLRRQEGYDIFQYHNLTDILEDTRFSDTVFQTPGGEIIVAGLLMDSQARSLEIDMEEEIVGHQEPEQPEKDGEIVLEAVYNGDGSESEQGSEGGEVNSEMVFEFDTQAEIKTATDADMKGGEEYVESLSEEEESDGQETDGVEGQSEYDQKKLKEGRESETKAAQNDEKNIVEAESAAHQIEDVESAAFSGHQQVDTEVANAETGFEEEGIGEIAESSSDISAETTDEDGNDLEEDSRIGEEVANEAAEWKEILLSNQKKVVVLFSTVMVMLAAAAAFLLAKKKAKPAMMLHEDGEAATISDAKEVNFEHVPVENLIKEKLCSLNFHEEEEEVDDDRTREVSSFPSEMSFSSKKNKSLHGCNDRDDLKEYQSGGGGGRKSNDSGESMASSASEYTIGSVSYGSFTTYEKIQKRSGRKEKEMVTPVRRSSRIRNHQHSGNQ
ncbi:unnamed protein product [Thlaspi arvense]|uniref:Uncharacterized protein n=1 Tax=Thlaspi arvense TaxID=13288 RepID=A0AAU9RBC4_THLAR|nr:unnamed protein product [Thlaspi arvense]